jgi:hypothetical protein
MGIIINFASGEVAGFDGFGGGLATYYHAAIAAINDVTIYFRGGSDKPYGSLLDGSLDRVTGDLDATTTSLGEKEILSTTRYLLHCKPTQRMF